MAARIKRIGHFIREVLLALLFLAGSCFVRLDGQRFIVYDREMLGTVRSLYAGMRTEFAGCLYGRTDGDTTFVRFFVPASFDPRLASDSEVTMRSCPIILGDHLVGIFHSHPRAGSACAPSGFPNGEASGPLPPDSLQKDRAVLRQWMVYGVVFSAIMCTKGDSIVHFSIDTHGVLTGTGMFGLPPLDSIYPK